MSDELLTRLRDLSHDLYDNHEQPEKLRHLIREYLSDYVSSNCSHPKKIVIHDKYTSQPREILVPCGKCAHCRDQRQGEWCSRMILNTLYCYKHAYFITLTYRSFDMYEDIPMVLRDAYYRLDDINELKRLTYSPCLLRHEHVQRFMKYLRKNHGDDYICMFQGSEYGSTYGRPHHHIILWCNEPISRADIVRAWSCRIPKSKRVVHIGRIDYNDLNANGTVIKADGIIFGNDMRKCFNYVAKYVTKSFIDPNDEIDRHSRLELFMRDLCSGCALDAPYVFTKRIRQMVALLRNWSEYFATYARENEFLERSYSDPFVKLNKNIYYDEETSDYSYLHLTTGDNEIVLQEETDFLVREFYQTGFKPCVLRKVFNAYCNASRAKGVGMEFYAAHADEYLTGKFNLPTYNGKKLLLPRLFVRKTKERLLWYAQQTEKIIGESASVNIFHNQNVFDKCFPPLPCVDLLAPSDSVSPQYNRNGAQTFDGKIGHIYLPDIDLCPVNVQQLLRSSYAFVDYRTMHRCLAFVDSDGDCFIRSYAYKRSTKSYVFVSQISFDKFCQQLYSTLSLFDDFYNQQLENSQKNLKEYDALTEFLDDACTNIFEYTDYDSSVLIYDAYCVLYEKLRNCKNKVDSLCTTRDKQ